MKWRCKFQQARIDNEPASSTLSEISQKACITGLQNALWWSNKPSIFASIRLQNWNAIDNPVSPSSLSNFNNSIRYVLENSRVNTLQPPFLCLVCITDDTKWITLEPKGSPPAAHLLPSHWTNSPVLVEWAFRAQLPGQWHASPQKIFPLPVLTLVCLKLGLSFQNDPIPKYHGLVCVVEQLDSLEMEAAPKMLCKMCTQHCPGSERSTAVRRGCTTSNSHHTPRHQQAHSWHFKPLWIHGMLLVPHSEWSSFRFAAAWHPSGLSDDIAMFSSNITSLLHLFIN